MRAKHKDLIKRVCIPILERSVLGARDEIVRLGDKSNLGDGIVVSLETPMAISKIQAPNFHVFVSCKTENVSVSEPLQKTKKGGKRIAYLRR